MIEASLFRRVLRQTLILPLVGLFVLAVLLFAQINDLLAAAGWVDHTDRVIAQARLERRIAEEMPGRERSYLLTGEPRFLAGWEQAAPDFTRSLDALEQLVADNPSQVTHARTIGRVGAEYIAASRQEIEAYNRKHDYLALVRGGRADRLLDDLRTRSDDFVTREEQLRNERTETSQRAARVVRVTVLLMTLVLGIVVTAFLRSQMRKLAESYSRAFMSIQDQADALRKSAQEIQALNVGLEHRVAERTAELQASNMELEAFSYSVSHDLRAPLRSIDGMSQALLEDYDGALDAEGRKYLERLRANSRQMGTLIDALLELSRVTRSDMRREPVNLSDLAKEITEDLHARYPDRVVDVEIAPDLSAAGDRRLLRIVLQNLIGNAWKYTSNRDAAAIRIDSEQKAGETVYRVADNGAGFDMAYYDKLFGAFQRLHSVREFEGTGIGLATVQRIVRRHGGRIWAEAAVNEGATFYFTLS